MSTTKTAFLLLIAAACSLLLTGATSTVPAPSAPPPSPYDYFGHNCYQNMQNMSHCLIYLTAPSNETAKMWENACCPEFAAQVNSNATTCLCFLLEDDKMEKLGLKIDKSRANPLPSICGVAQSIECRQDDGTYSYTGDTPPPGNHDLSRSTVTVIWAVGWILTISIVLLCVIVDDHGWILTSCSTVRDSRSLPNPPVPNPYKPSMAPAPNHSRSLHQSSCFTALDVPPPRGPDHSTPPLMKFIFIILLLLALAPSPTEAARFLLNAQIGAPIEPADSPSNGATADT